MGEKPECFSYAHKLQRYGQKGSEKMSESKQTRRDVIDAELQKTKAELAIAKHREAKLRNQIKGMTEKERRHRNIVSWILGVNMTRLVPSLREPHIFLPAY